MLWFDSDCCLCMRAVGTWSGYRSRFSFPVAAPASLLHLLLLHRLIVLPLGQVDVLQLQLRLAALLVACTAG